MKRLLPYLCLFGLLLLAGCNEDWPDKSTKTDFMAARLPDRNAIMIVTDELGNRYIVQRSHSDSFWLYQVSPYDLPKSAK